MDNNIKIVQFNRLDKKYSCTHRYENGEPAIDKFGCCNICKNKFYGNIPVSDVPEIIDKFRSTLEMTKLLASKEIVKSKIDLDDVIGNISTLLYHLDKYGNTTMDIIKIMDENS
jgi:hypothetical protein